MSKKHLLKTAISTALFFSLSLSMAACGSKDTVLTPKDNDEVTTTTESKDDNTNSNLPVSSIFDTNEREIWYIVDNIDKDSSVGIAVIENGTLTKYALAGSGIKLGDFAKLSDDEVISTAKENYNSYIGYDLSKMKIYLKTDSSGNKVESESIYLPITSIVSFEVLPVVDQIQGCTLNFKSAAGIVNPILGTIYDSSYYGYNFSDKYWIKRSDTKVSLSLDGTDYSGAYLDEDIHKEEFLNDGVAEDTGIQAYQSSEAIDGFKKKGNGYIAEFVDVVNNNYFCFENITISDSKATYSK